MNPPSRRMPVSADLRLLAALIAVWLGPWAALTVASWAAGGEPHSSPVDFASPSRVIARVRAHAGTPAPWQFVDAHRPAVDVVFWTILLVLTLLLLAALALLLRAGHRPRAGRRRRLPATSRWATWWDLRRLRARHPTVGRFVLGRRGRALIVTERETSVLVVGPTRSGKTSGLVIPNLFDWGGPAVVTSTKSEIVDVAGAHRQSIGPVYVYDPTGEATSAYRSITWSPIDGCRSLDRAWRIAAWLCAPLQSGSSRGDNDWAHWAESGKLLIAPLLYAAANTGHTIVDVCGWIHSFDLGTPTHLIESMLGAQDEEDADDAERALSMLSAVDQRPERERGTVFSTVMRIFSAFNERAVAQSAMTSRFAADELIRRNGTLFLCTPQQAPQRVASLFVGILMTVVTAAYRMAEREPMGRLAVDLGLFLDELANVVPIEDLPSLASQGAGRGVLLMSIVQDLSQLRSRYGVEGANSIINNHGCKVVLPGISDPDTADVLARLIGREQVSDVQVSRAPDGRASRTYSLRHEPMANPDSLRQLPGGTAIVVYRDRPPAIVSLRPWFRSRRLRARARRRFFRSADYAGRKL